MFCFQLQWFGKNNPDFRTGNVLEDGHRPLIICGQGADPGNEHGVVMMVAMGEVEPEDIDSRADQAEDDIFAFRCRAKCNDDFCFLHFYGTINESSASASAKFSRSR